MKKFLLNSFAIGMFLTFVSHQIYREHFEFFNLAELKAYDFKIRNRGPRPVSGNVALIAVDEKSLKEQGRWPWPRSKLGELVDKLSNAGVAAIGFDILFPEPQTQVRINTIKEKLKNKNLTNVNEEELFQWLDEASDSDAIFARSLENSQRSVLGFFADPFGTNPTAKNISELGQGTKDLLEWVC